MTEIQSVLPVLVMAAGVIAMWGSLREKVSRLEKILERMELKEDARMARDNVLETRLSKAEQALHEGNIAIRLLQTQSADNSIAIAVLRDGTAPRTH